MSTAAQPTGVRDGDSIRSIIAVLGAALVFCYVDVFRILAGQWWTNDVYSHGFLIPAIAAFFVWHRRDALARSERVPQPLKGGIVMTGGLLMLALGRAIDVVGLQELSTDSGYRRPGPLVATRSGSAAAAGVSDRLSAVHDAGVGSRAESTPLSIPAALGLARRAPDRVRRRAGAPSTTSTSSCRTSRSRSPRCAAASAIWSRSRQSASRSACLVPRSPAPRPAPRRRDWYRRPRQRAPRLAHRVPGVPRCLAGAPRPRTRVPGTVRGDARLCGAVWRRRAPPSSARRAHGESVCCTAIEHGPHVNATVPALAGRGAGSCAGAGRPRPRRACRRFDTGRQAPRPLDRRSARG